MIFVLAATDDEFLRYLRPQKANTRKRFHYIPSLNDAYRMLGGLEGIRVIILPGFQEREDAIDILSYIKARRGEFWEL